MPSSFGADTRLIRDQPWQRGLRGRSQLLGRSILNNGSSAEIHMIFQGAIDVMQRADKKVDPDALAASIGFGGPDQDARD
ncbi:hypothetical protein ACVWXO_006023 [Bradyrhizobium sp. LM2.7]